MSGSLLLPLNLSKKKLSFPDPRNWPHLSRLETSSSSDVKAKNKTDISNVGRI